MLHNDGGLYSVNSTTYSNLVLANTNRFILCTYIASRQKKFCSGLNLVVTSLKIGFRSYAQGSIPKHYLPFSRCYFAAGLVDWLD